MRKSKRDDSSKDAILRAATSLFATKGYHGTSTRDIAEKSGYNLSTMHYHFGGKRELYLQVVETLFLEENYLFQKELFEKGIETVGSKTEFYKLLNSFLDKMVDLMASDTNRARLYMHRWMEPPDEFSSKEAEFSLMLHTDVNKMLAKAFKKGFITTKTDLGLFLRSVSWVLYGYFVSGPIDWQKWRGDPLEKKNMKKFKGFLHSYVECLLGYRR